MSDQYVSVPRELLERINTQLSEDWDRIDGEWGPSGYTLDQEVVRGEQPVIAELRALLDAPAEDVRAVGEEPVAWEAIFDGVQRDVTGRLGFTETARDVYTENGATIEPLYRHPQRPVALPDRKQNTHQGLSHSDARSAGWNACLDAVEELNK